MTTTPQRLLELNRVITACREDLELVVEEHRAEIERCGPEAATMQLIAMLRRCELRRLASIAGVAIAMLARRDSP